jgi:hypothetical protein
MLMAVTGQLSTACWQSQVSQAAGLVTHALSSRSSKTFGQSSVQSPQPIQVSMSILGVAMIFPPSHVATMNGASSCAKVTLNLKKQP